MSHQYAEITSGEASQSLDEYHLVDVREPEEFVGELGHIAGSQLLPLGELVERVENGEDRTTLFPGAPGRPLLVICRSGNRSGKACALLGEAGLARATNLVGGMLEWNRADLPIDRGAAREADALHG